MEIIKMGQNKRVVCIIVALLMLCYFAMACNTTKTSSKSSVVNGFYIFGDSLVDNGNNNNILTLARANYQPYGIDYPSGPTGRFCNGKTMVDALGELLGFKEEIPSFSRLNPSTITRGVNFASGASGIREETGNNLGAHYSMAQQVRNFERVVQELRRHFRSDNALQNYLSKCIIYSGMGSNDYLNNYFMTNYYTTSSQFGPTEYAEALLQEYFDQLSRLYQIGVRKVVVAGVGKIGCIPYALARTNGTSKSPCDEEQNNIVGLFNTGLRQLVDEFNGNRFPGAMFVYLESNLGASDLSSSGFEVFDRGCCGVGKNNGQITCLPMQEPCGDRTKYLFWDAFHPTETVNVLLAKKAYTSKSKSYAYPINVKQLTML